MLGFEFNLWEAEISLNDEELKHRAMFSFMFLMETQADV